MNSSAAIVTLKYKWGKYKSRYYKTETFRLTDLKQLFLKKLDSLLYSLQ